MEPTERMEATAAPLLMEITTVLTTTVEVVYLMGRPMPPRGVLVVVAAVAPVEESD